MLEGGVLDGGVLEGRVLEGGVLEGGMLEGGVLEGRVLDLEPVMCVHGKVCKDRCWEDGVCGRVWSVRYD